MSKGKRYFNLKSSTYYLQMKTKILADFQICISVPLSKKLFSSTVNNNAKFSVNSMKKENVSVEKKT